MKSFEIELKFRIILNYDYSYIWTMAHNKHIQLQPFNY